MLTDKNIKFSYDMSDVWDYEVITKGNTWMDLDIEKEIISTIGNVGFYNAVNSLSLWNKISVSMFSTPVVLDAGEVNFLVPNTSGYLQEESEFMSSVGEAISAFKRKGFEKSLFPSSTIFNVSKKEISGLEISPSLYPLKSNIAYNLIVLFLILNIAI